jgi:hypothetical protein
LTEKSMTEFSYTFEKDGTMHEILVFEITLTGTVMSLNTHSVLPLASKFSPSTFISRLPDNEPPEGNIECNTMFL